MGKNFASIQLSNIIRNSSEYKDWRNTVFKRYNYTCRFCESGSREINAHHIIRFGELIKENNITSIEDAINCAPLWNINNGITLCESCHDNIHHDEVSERTTKINLKRWHQ